MSTTIGLFEDPNHVNSVVDALKEAGFSEQDIRTLGKEYITPDADLATRYKRASDMFGILGVLVGGLAGMAISAAVSTVVSYSMGTMMGSTGIVLALTLGAALGAVLGSIIGTSVIPSLMARFNMLGQDNASRVGHLNRNGLLVAVNTNENNTMAAAEIMRKREVVNLETHSEPWPAVSLQPA